MEVGEQPKRTNWIFSGEASAPTRTVVRCANAGENLSWINRYENYVNARTKAAQPTAENVTVVPGADDVDNNDKPRTAGRVVGS